MITQPSCRHCHLLVSLCPLLGHPDSLSAGPLTTRTMMCTHLRHPPPHHMDTLVSQLSPCEHLIIVIHCPN
ncbi:hypothetical protein C345_05337 [Cryptococcus neoformans A2-102-5]|nr:hypothetical protein C346_05441 [Cryptococcus neoformans var. grubii D17-1]OXG92782.1 hypothetical protein C345_05337 [Cryptococcus neoformans var. grubii A2-102-5]